MRSNIDRIFDAIYKRIYFDIKCNYGSDAGHTVARRVAGAVKIDLWQKVGPSLHSSPVTVKFRNLGRFGQWDYCIRLEVGNKNTTAFFGWDVIAPDYSRYYPFAVFCLDGEREERIIFVTRENERRILAETEIYLGNRANEVVFI